MVELSSLDVLFLARELSVLQDAYLDKVYEVEPGTFLFRTRHPERGRHALLVRPGSFACLAAEVPETPQSPTSFATLLRKHLPGLRIRRVDQHDFDRVLVFHLDERGEPLRLVVELFGKGNLILVGADGKVRLAQRSETFRDRTIKRGEPFRFPASRVNPLTLSRDGFEQLASKSERDVVRFLATDVAFGPDLAEELVHRAKIMKDRKASSLTAPERGVLWSAWNEVRAGPPSPVVATRDGAARVEATPLGTPKFAAWSRAPTPTLSEAIQTATRLEAQARPAPTNEEAERLRRQLEHQKTSIEELHREADALEAMGRAVYEHYAHVKAGLEAAKKSLEEQGWGAFGRLAEKGAVDASIAKVEPDARLVHLRLGSATVAMVPTDSIEANASRIFEEGKRVRAKAENAETALEETRRLLAAADRPRPVAAPVQKAPEKRFWFEAFRWFYTTEDFLVVAGRDAGSNEKLVKKHLGPGDLYFHADVHGAPSCILKAEGKTPGEESIRQAAHFAAAYSRAFAQFGSSDAYWVRPEQVSKTAPSGEFVAKGSFMVRGQRNYLTALPMEVALGLLRVSKDGRADPEGPFSRLVGGPAVAIQARSTKWVIVARGDQKPAALFKELATYFGVSFDEVQSALPTSTIRILRRAEDAA